MGKYPDHLVETLIDSGDLDEIAQIRKAIIEIRDQPSWAGALVVLDRQGDYWGLSGGTYRELTSDISYLSGPAAWVEKKYGPVEIIINATGGNERVGTE